MTASVAQVFLDALRARLQAGGGGALDVLALDVDGTLFAGRWREVWGAGARLDISGARSTGDGGATRVGLAGTATLPGIAPAAPGDPPAIAAAACDVVGQFSIADDGALHAALRFAPRDGATTLGSLLPALPPTYLADDDEDAADPARTPDAGPIFSDETLADVALLFSTHAETADANRFLAGGGRFPLEAGLGLAFAWTSEASRIGWASAATHVVHGSIVLSAETAPPRLPEGSFPCYWKQGQGVYLTSSLGGDRTLVPGLAIADPVFRVYSPLVSDLPAELLGYEPIMAYTGSFALDAVKAGLRGTGTIAAATFRDFAERLELACRFDDLPLPGIGDLFGLGEAAPVDLLPPADSGAPRAPAALSLRGASLTAIKRDSGWAIASAGFEIGIGSAGWTTAGFAITAKAVRVAVTDPATPDMAWSVWLEGSVAAFGVDLDVQVTVPGFEVHARQRGGLRLPLRQALGHAPNAAAMPGLGADVDLTIDRMALDLRRLGDSWDYRASMRARVDATLGPAGGTFAAVEFAVSTSEWRLEARAGEGSAPAGLAATLGSLATAIVPPSGGGAFAVPSTSIPEALVGFQVTSLALAARAGGTYRFAGSGLLPLGGKQLEASVDVEVSADGATAFTGRVQVAGVTFELDLRGASADGPLVVAGFQNAAGRELRLDDLLASLTAEAPKTNVALLARRGLILHWPQSSGREALWVAGVEAEVRLSRIELGDGLSIGGSGPGQSEALGLDLVLLVPSRSPRGQADLDAIKNALPPHWRPADGNLDGVRIVPRLRVGGVVQEIAFKPSLQLPRAPAAAPTGGVPPRLPASNAVWKDIQRSFGPVRVERVGLGAEGDRVAVLLDASLEAAGLTLSLQELGIGFPLQTLAPEVSLRGLGLDYRNDLVEIGGSFLRVPPRAAGESTAFVGAAVAKTRAFAVEVLGAYQTVAGHPSLFLYATVDYPLGGPAFFFVTGLAAAFGFNRRLALPPMERLAQFPLLAEKAPANHLDALDQMRDYIPPQEGAVFAGVGLKFTSFRVVQSTALATASFHKGLSLDLIGRSTLRWPPVAEQGEAAAPPVEIAPLALVEMVWQASLHVPGTASAPSGRDDEEGRLALRAQLAPSSYLFAPDCHLSGGFAFYTWFSGQHRDDFVITLGGYAPRSKYVPPAHYPQVPRLALAWQVSDQLSIKGEAYYALTPSTMMAGGRLDAVWEDESFRVAFHADINAFISWKPVRYDAEVDVEVAASYTFDFCGTHRISANLAAAVHVWGPPFGLSAHVDLTVVSFDVTFGEPLGAPEAIHLPELERSFLPPRASVCGVSMMAGLVASDGDVWVIDPAALRLAVSSAVPAKQILFGGEHHFVDEQQAGDRKAFPSGPPPGVPTGPSFGVAPMNARVDQVHSTMRIDVVDAQGRPASHLFEVVELVRKKVPAAIWGTQGMRAVPADRGLLETACGLEIVAKKPAALPAAVSIEKDYAATSYTGRFALPWKAELAGGGAGEAARESLVLPERTPGKGAIPDGAMASVSPPDETEGDPPVWSDDDEVPAPPPLHVGVAPNDRASLPPGTYTVSVAQELEVAGESASYPPGKPRRFRVLGGAAGEEQPFSLPPSCFGGVFPPEGGRGAYAGILPHVVLDRSALPWEHVAEAADSPHPSLALLVLDDDEVAAASAGPGGDGVLRLDPTSCAALVPSGPERALLTHVRTDGASPGAGSPRARRAVVVASRLPKPNARSTAHLVSLAGRYDAAGKLVVAHDGKVELRSLFSWSFSCDDRAGGFGDTVGALSVAPFALGERGAHLSEEERARGATSLIHLLETGESRASAYSGPLVSQLGAPGASISYAAAAELGRLLTLQRKAIAVSLFRWKRRHAHDARERREQQSSPHLYGRTTSPASRGGGQPETMPGEIQDWVARLQRLEGVPFRYLLPDERLLKKDSLAFVRLDPAWVDALVAGALGVGSVWRDNDVRGAVARLPAAVTGVLLRSEVIAGWPDMDVEASDSAKRVLPVWSKVPLSKTILLVLFEGLLARVMLRTGAETLHLVPSLFARDGERFRTFRVPVVTGAGASSPAVVASWLAPPESVLFDPAPEASR